jgi:uncharacterized protein
MIMLDSNIFMYAAGVAHPNKKPCLQLLERIASGTIDAVIDAEVLQEILHRYRSIHRWEDGCRVFELARQIVPIVVPVTDETLDLAIEIMKDYPELMARDALHAAACQIAGSDVFCSYDEDFDNIPDLKRQKPEDII